jgi:hypothetical protein
MSPHWQTRRSVIPLSHAVAFSSEARGTAQVSTIKRLIGAYGASQVRTGRAQHSFKNAHRDRDY